MKNYLFSKDEYDGDSCAINRHGGWWYSECTFVNPTGEYGFNGAAGESYINWFTGYLSWEALKTINLTIIPK